MDSVDFAIYRYLSPDGSCRFWGSRRLIDPQQSAREIGDRVGLSETGVRARLKALAERGLLRGSQVHLNPSLFDASLAYADLPVGGAKEARGVLSELALVDGVTFARDLLDEEDRKVRVFFVQESAAVTARRVALLGRLAPSHAVRGPTPYWIPPADRLPSPLDWKLLRALRESPDASLSATAEAVHLSLKTTAKRVKQLVESRACWWTHSDASEEWPLALLWITLEAKVTPAAVAHRIESENPGWTPAARDGLGIAPGTPFPVVAGLVPVETPAALERAVQRALALEGVANVGRTFGLGSATYRQWTDERLANRLGSPA